MLYYKTQEEVELIRQSSLLVGKTIARVAAELKPGITTASADKIAEEFIRSQGGVPAFKGYHGFPGSLCISLNDEVVHGIPGKREIREGDIVSVDCGVLKDGFYGDSGYTFAIGEVQPEWIDLMRVTRECLTRAVEQAVAGKRIGDISWAVQEWAEHHRYGVVRELVGHGIGRHLHEKPEVPNYGKRGTGLMLREGLVIAIEPMINLGRSPVKQANDGWTIQTKDARPSAHYEHTVAIRKGKADVLSSFSEIDEAVAANGWLKETNKVIA